MKSSAHGRQAQDVLLRLLRRLQTTDGLPGAFRYSGFVERRCNDAQGKGYTPTYDRVARSDIYPSAGGLLVAALARPRFGPEGGGNPQ